MNSISDKIFTSGFWSFTLEEANKFIGCDIYFHNKLSEPSYRGGQIIGIELRKYKDKERILFKIIEKNENVGKPWYGDISIRQWYSIKHTK
tara:strand:+ start:1891 stop:2163 length:273 start_codon:yes stop_codon:yes gene_type:complete